MSKLCANMEVLSIEKTYFEEHAGDLLNNAGFNKAQFAKAMGVAPQNVGKLFATKNAITLSKIGKILNVSLNCLVHGVEQDKEDIHGCLFVNGNPVLINSRKDLEDFLKQEKIIR